MDVELEFAASRTDQGWRKAGGVGGAGFDSHLYPSFTGRGILSSRFFTRVSPRLRQSEFKRNVEFEHVISRSCSGCHGTSFGAFESRHSGPVGTRAALDRQMGEALPRGCRDVSDVQRHYPRDPRVQNGDFSLSHALVTPIRVVRVESDGRVPHAGATQSRAHRAAQAQ
jgi:hypothetical protein